MTSTIEKLTEHANVLGYNEDQKNSFVKGYSERGRYGYIDTLKHHDTYMVGVLLRLNEDKETMDLFLNTPLPDDSHTNKSILPK